MLGVIITIMIEKQTKEQRERERDKVMENETRKKKKTGETLPVSGGHNFKEFNEEKKNNSNKNRK